MAKGTKELKQRITGVQNIQQITRAMEMVATQKLMRLQLRADAARPFSSKIQEMVGRLAGSVRSDLSPLLAEREVETVANLMVASDKGMCGGYNANLVRFSMVTMDGDEDSSEASSGGPKQILHVLGNKGDILMRARKRSVDHKYEDVVEKIDYTRVRNMVNELVADFLSGKIDRLRIIYTAFISAGRQRPAAVTILPIDPDELKDDVGEDEGGSGEMDFIVEPDSEQLLKELLPKFLEIKVYSAILESLASEFTARRNAMKQATDAADEMIGALKRQYNRARQESITSELLEVSSGAEALK
ncbi:MAG: ATP synthase F1 subunit gamma [Planctomycetota bacterium]|jgi:F-type H+-transporting ATPase subunit gamma|nr:ATP synthase F1 subunit gamma [Planctomycetota bacterium]